MKLINFKSLMESEANQVMTAPNDINEQADLLIENQQYDKLAELSENGYKLKNSQTKALFLAFLSFSDKNAKARNNFFITSWQDALKKISQYDRVFSKTTCNYMAKLLINDKYIRKLSPHRSLFSNPLNGWSAPNSYEEVLWAHAFLKTMKEQMALHVSSTTLNQVKDNANNIDIDKCSTLAYRSKADIVILTEEIFDLSMQNHHELNLSSIKKSHEPETKVDKVDEKNNDEQNIMDKLPTQSQKSLTELYSIIHSINQDKLEETEKLDFINLLNNQLPQMLQSYLNINEKNREKMISGESANSILEDNFTKFKNLFSEIKEKQEQAELLLELNNLKINNQYLKSKM